MCHEKEQENESEQRSIAHQGAVRINSTSSFFQNWKIPE
jgi:hypothetical protein